MNKKNAFFYFPFIIVLSITTNLFSAPPQQEEKQPHAVVYCDFSLDSLDGEKFCLKDYQAQKRTVHLFFWSTWCPHCLLEMPDLKKLYQAIGNKPYEILAINVCLNESIKRIKKFEKQYQIPCKILLDEKGEVSKCFGVVGIPCHIIIDKEGVIIDRFSELPKDPTKYLNQFSPH